MDEAKMPPPSTAKGRASALRATPLQPAAPLLHPVLLLADPPLLILATTAGIFVSIGAIHEAALAGLAAVLFAVFTVVKTAPALRGARPPAAARVRRVSVARNGRYRRLRPTDLRPQDQVLLETGDRVPAPCEVLETDSLTLEDGTSPAPGDKIEAGALVSAGRATAVVRTLKRRGQLAASARPSPGDSRLPLLVQGLLVVITATILAGAVAASIAAVDRLRSPVAGREVLLLAVALLVLAIPPGRVAAMASALRVTARHAARAGVWTAHGAALEALSRTSYLCLDRETVLRGDRSALKAVRPIAEISERHLLRSGFAAVSNTTDREVLASALEAALGDSGGPDVSPRLIARRDRLSGGVLSEGAEPRLCLCGPAARILAICADVPEDIAQEATTLAGPGHEVLGVADLAFSERALSPVDTASGPRLLGLIAVETPLPDGSAAAVDDARAGGIRSAVMTREDQASAQRIGRSLGLLARYERIATGDDIDAARHRGQGPVDNIVRPARIFAETGATERARIADSYHRDAHMVLHTLGDDGETAPDLSDPNDEDTRAPLRVAVADRSRDAILERADAILLDPHPRALVDAIAVARGGFLRVRAMMQAIAGFGTGVLLLAAVLTVGGREGLPPPAALFALSIGISAMTDIAFSFGETARRPVPQTSRRGGQRVLRRGWLWQIAASATAIAGTGTALTALSSGAPLFAASATEAASGAIFLLLATIAAGRVLVLRRIAGQSPTGLPGLVALACAIGLVALAAAAVFWPPLATHLGLAAPPLATLGAIGVLAAIAIAAEELIRRASPANRS
ncbi:MAG: cation transporting ATPase C-terminal domain-containing protein [Pseudomonadota bacterium]